MEVKMGLETHVQLNTKTKLFCRCKNGSSEDTNTLTCPTCLGMPGSKPMLNKEAVDKALKIAVFFNCKVPKQIIFSRKSYFYPDLSKNYQITQYEFPVGEKGEFIFSGKKIEFRRIQLEEDPASIEHVGGSITNARYTKLDYNRSGAPLVEIVTEPCFSNLQEVEKYLTELKKVLFYLEVYKDGEIKSDCNVSVTGGKRVEIKNVSGIRNVLNALKYETEEQKKNKSLVEETKAWNEDKQKTELLRKKESEDDYGYIFEPDLAVIEASDRISLIKKQLPKSPEEKFKELLSKGIEKERAKIISSDYQLLKLFEEVSKSIDTKDAANLVSGPIKKNLNYFDIDLSQSDLSFIVLDVIKQYKTGKITDRGLELAFRTALKEGKYSVSDFEKISENEIEKLVDEVVKENIDVVEKVKNGKESSFEYLVGQVIKKSKGKADPKTTRELLKKGI